MTQEEKKLLLKDLCARLPYGVVVETTWKEKVSDETCEGTIGKLRGSQIEFLEEDEYSDIKPYLRAMSSMTEEEFKEYKSTWVYLKHEPYTCVQSVESYDWLNAHHFDYRGLIEMGLAIAVTEGNNPYKG